MGKGKDGRGKEHRKRKDKSHKRSFKDSAEGQGDSLPVSLNDEDNQCKFIQYTFVYESILTIFL